MSTHDLFKRIWLNEQMRKILLIPNGVVMIGIAAYLLSVEDNKTKPKMIIKLLLQVVAHKYVSVCFKHR